MFSPSFIEFGPPPFPRSDTLSQSGPLKTPGVRALSDLGGGGVDFLARKIYAIPECVIVEIREQTHSNCTKNIIRSQFTVSREICRGSLISRILDFVRFRGEKNCKFGFLTRGNNFSRIACTIFESRKKMGAIWLFSLHCLQPISLKFSNVKQRSKFLLDFCRKEFVITKFNYRSSMKSLRNSR